MTQDEIIEMAKQAGFDFLNGWRDWGESCKYGEAWPEQIEAFAKLVAAKEREACAKVCEDNATDLSEGDWDSACINCADHIRERGEA